MGQSGRLILIDLKMRCPGSSPTSDWYAHTHWYIPPSGFRSCEKKKRNGKLSLSTKRKNESVSSCFCLQVIFQSVALVSDVNDWAKWNKAPPPCEREREREKRINLFFFPLTVSDDESPGTLPWFFTSAVLCAGVYVVVAPVISRDSSLLSPPLGSHDVITFDPPGRREKGVRK